MDPCHFGLFAPIPTRFTQFYSPLFVVHQKPHYHLAFFWRNRIVTPTYQCTSINSHNGKGHFCSRQCRFCMDLMQKHNGACNVVVIAGVFVAGKTVWELEMQKRRMDSSGTNLWIVLSWSYGHDTGDMCKSIILTALSGTYTETCSLQCLSYLRS